MWTPRSASTANTSAWDAVDRALRRFARADEDETESDQAVPLAAVARRRQLPR
jgi:hypothetical protein